jgi:hypothetical protein
MKSHLVWLSGIALGAVLIVGAPSAKANVSSVLTYQGMIGNIDVNNAIDSTDGDSITLPQTHWSGRVKVPRTTGTSLVIQNSHVNIGSAILVSPENSTAGSVGPTVTSVIPGSTFTVSLPNVVGTGSGRITGLNYEIINPGSDEDGVATSQTNWDGQVSVPSSVDTSFVVHDTHVKVLSAILITPVSSTAASDCLTVTSVSAGSFTVGSKNAMGSGDGAITAVNYLIINQ